MHKINQDKSTDAHRLSSKLWRLDAEMLYSMGKELGGISHCSGFMLPLNHSECYFCFSPFFIKAKILCGFLLHSENRYSCRSFLKAKWHEVNFQQARNTCSSVFTFSNGVVYLYPFDRQTLVLLPPSSWCWKNSVDAAPSKKTSWVKS